MLDSSMTPASETRAVDRHARVEPGEWPAVLSLAVTTFVLVTTEFMPAGLLPAIADEFGVTEGRAGLLVTVPGMVAAVAAPVAVVACSRLDRRKVLLSLVVLLAASNALLAMATDFATALAARVLLGVAVGAYWTIGGSLGPRLVPGARSVRATGVILSGIALGGVAGVPAGTILGDLYGWHWSFWFTALLAAAIFVVQWLVVPSLPGGPASSFATLGAVSKRPSVRVGLALTALTFVGHFGAFTYIAPLLVHAVGKGAAVGGLLLLFGIGTILGNAAGSFLIGRQVRAAVMIAAGGIATAVFVLAGSSGFAAVVIAVAVWGASYGILPVALQTWMFRANPDGPESVTGLYVCVAQVSIGMGSLLGGAAIDGLDVQGPFWLGGLTASIAILLAASARGRSAAV